jgi:hypothetical protein
MPKGIRGEETVYTAGCRAAQCGSQNLTSKNKIETVDSKKKKKLVDT